MMSFGHLLMHCRAVVRRYANSLVAVASGEGLLVYLITRNLFIYTHEGIGWMKLKSLGVFRISHGPPDAPVLSTQLQVQAIKQQLLHKTVKDGDKQKIIPFQGYHLVICCKIRRGKRSVEVVEDTEIYFVDDIEPKQTPVDLTSFDRAAVRTLRIILNRRFKCKNETLNSRMCSNSLLICGPSGSGKSTVVKALASEFDIPIARLEMLDSVNVEADLLLRELISANSERIVLIDHAEMWLSDLNDPQLSLQLLSYCRSRETKALVIAISNDPGLIRDIVRECFDHIVTFGPPTTSQRLHIWKKHFGTQLAEELTSNSHGFLGGDIQSVLRKIMVQKSYKKVTDEDIIEIVKNTLPSALLNSSVGIEIVPSREIELTFNDVCGLIKAKQALIEMVIWPFRYRKLLAGSGVEMPKGILLYGPAGTGKTMLASAVAKEAEMHFISVRITDLIHGEVGESEKAIAYFFRMAAQIAPCVLFFDEFQAIFGKRADSGKVGRKMISQLLIEMDHLARSNLRVIIMGATNLPENIDPTLLRQGRFDRKIYVPLPDLTARIEILNSVKSKLKPWPKELSVETAAKLTEGYSGAEIANLCNQAALIALQDNPSDVTKVRIREEYLKQHLQG